MIASCAQRNRNRETHNFYGRKRKKTISTISARNHITNEYYLLPSIQKYDLYCPFLTPGSFTPTVTGDLVSDWKGVLYLGIKRVANGVS